MKTKKACGYLNSGNNTAPIFSLHQKNFLQENTLDFGAGAYPAHDYNSDGLLDIIGTLAISMETMWPTCYFKKHRYYQPASFTLVEDDFANLGNLPLNTLLNMPVRACLLPGDLDGMVMTT